MSFRSLTDDRDHKIQNVLIHRKAGKRRSNSAPSISVDKKRDVNATDSKGRSCLFYAAKYGEIEIVRHLLDNGADPDIHDKGLNFPLHEAIDSGHLEVVDLLLRKGCNIDCKNISGQTPLMRAVLFDDVEATKLLVKAGANLDEAECTGKTALLVGLQEGNDHLCRYLIKNGCNVNIVDQLGQSALYFAVHRINIPSLSMCQKLFRYGYDPENDSDWLSKDLYEKLVPTGKGLFSRILQKIGLFRTKIDFDVYHCEDLLSDDYVDVRAL